MREATLWFWQLISGVIILVLLSVHMVVQNWESILAWFGAQNSAPLAYESVIARSNSPGWTVLYIALLALALYHGFYGLRAILLEWLPAKAERSLSGILAVIAIVAFIFGTYVTISSYNLGG